MMVHTQTEWHGHGHFDRMVATPIYITQSNLSKKYISTHEWASMTYCKLFYGLEHFNEMRQKVFLCQKITQSLSI